MIKFCSLFSGSSGNCIFLGTEHTKILIDAGVNAKHIAQGLCAIGENPDAIDGILITHEHADHIQGAGVFARRHHANIYANQETWRSMDKTIGPLFREQRQIYSPSGGGSFQIGDICIRSFSIPHDAADPVAYTCYAEDRQISVVTDIGSITNDIRANTHGSDALVLEANHDVEMLMTGTYPWPLKKRIRGNQGHLSNDDAGAFATELAQDGTKCIFLGHLSQENNRPKLAEQTVCQQLYTQGFSVVNGSGTVDPDIFRTSAPLLHVSVAGQYKRSEVAIL